MEKIPKIFADFNNADPLGRIRLNNKGSIDDIINKRIDLKDGMAVLLDDDDTLTTIGLIKYSQEEGIWVGEINCKALK